MAKPKPLYQRKPHFRMPSVEAPAPFGGRPDETEDEQALRAAIRPETSAPPATDQTETEDARDAKG